MIASTLLRNEWLKAVKSLGFWVPVLATAGMQSLINGTRYYEASKNPEASFSLPDAWGSILSQGDVGFVFGTVAVILLVTNEFTWRTARQNVIDGLSKEQFFAGKLLLVAVLTLVFPIGQVLVASAFALAGTDFSSLTGSLIGPLQLKMLAGNCLAFIGLASIVIFISTAIRSGGAAMGVWFFYWMFAENIIGAIMRQVSETLGDAAIYLPTRVFPVLTRISQYDPDAFQQAVARATEANRPAPPEPWDWPLLLGWSLGWIALFLVSGFFWFRKRDL